ncbi:MAG: hypothetical protein PHD48_06765 [Alphaproteobacteria bacterium]|nr:hypothetical protein [Alphaproteobacteria bacterium]
MSLKDTYVSAWEIFPVEIEAGSAITGAINLGGLRLFGIIIPTEWSNANLTFQMSPDAGATWVNVMDQNGSEVLAMAGTSRCIVLDPMQFVAFQHLRLRSGTSAAPVSQSVLRTVSLLLRAV